MLERSFPFALLALAAAATPAGAGPDTQLYERAFMLEADRRCTLFTPEIRTALRVSAAQARYAATRAGRAPDVVEQRARTRARTAPCGSEDLRVAAARVRVGHEGWRKVQRITFPGAAAEWRADRTPAQAIRWRLVQARPSATFGLAGVSPAQVRPYVVARFPKKARPALVRLTVGRRTFLAETNAPAPEALATERPKGLLPPPAWAFRFPEAATAALDAAGPADAVRIDFITPGRARDSSRFLVIERGDYDAARAFIRP